ncbi:Hypothetical protein SRAE_1000076800 [Strongyloides ratti]|uniref:Uncharacterized protein n=1 Tax=Strongyloides ratti TaxID=34506 RepID=A0A090MUX3_STRRB|nr:Hypothetical protein SRAE_1000076800 [Strongyloides ratti]CEF62498.1 Hypothetical protein SRAE_1000076800 [Strongyloides ratti]
MNKYLCIIKRFTSSKPSQSPPKIKSKEPLLAHETKYGNITKKWNYRSEIVKHKKLDHKHYFIWLGFGAFSLIGGLFFITIKSAVLKNRKEEMQMRENLRKELELTGQERKQIGVMDSITKD